jgi:hypothetical protein
MIINTVQLAQITNPATGNLGNNPTAAARGQTFTSYFITVWQGVVAVGALMVILYFLWGAFDWIVAGSESGKTQKARDKMTNAAIGLVVLVGSYVLINFVSLLFFGNDFSILNPVFPTP